MKKSAVMIVLILVTGLIEPAFGEEIIVYLEPMPPLIIKQTETVASGYTVDMLRAIEKISDLKFHIRLSTYTRAKADLKDGRADLIGHSLWKGEPKEFYEYAQDLSWHVVGSTDIYSMAQASIQGNRYKTLKSIGTPRGNAESFSEMFQIPIKQFYEASHLEGLLKMLEAGRIDALIFERVSTMSSIQQLGIKNVFYRNLDQTMAASLAVRTDDVGKALKEKLDRLIVQVGYEKIFSEFQQYMNLPESGGVDVSK